MNLRAYKQKLKIKSKVTNFVKKINKIDQIGQEVKEVVKKCKIKIRYLTNHTVSHIIIKKSLSGLKSIICEFASQCQDWSEFLRRTKEGFEGRTGEEGKYTYTIENYKINICSTNPCYIKVELNRKRHRALIDTGAIVLLIPARVLEGTNIRLTRSSTIIRAASGTPLMITERCIDKNFRAGDALITFGPTVTERAPDL
ncbi:uncharacterized protein VNE69_09064 [Vairimorpha necatrix]|uniref:Peptidase A2 domain-containing protein n=1 Tax=Vairimorpha necatrix TaxID=6039 RepID=A0AAX4JEZ2_9MICR